MFDPQDDDFAGVFADPVEDAVRASPGGPHAGKVAAQRFADAEGFCDESCGEEVDHGSGDCLGKSIRQRPPGRWCEDEFVWLGLGHRARRRTASTPRTTLPWA